jgi:RNA polymerase sigma factor (sigma-70 family)
VSIVDELPKERLSIEEEFALARKIQAHQNDEDITRLVMHNMREAVLYLRRVTRGDLGDEELVSLTYSTLVQNAKRYHPGMRRFFVFAKLGLRGACKKVWTSRKVVRNGETVSSDFESPATDAHLPKDPDAKEEDPQAPDYQIVQPDFSGILSRERWEMIKPIIARKCSKREQQMLELRYHGGFSSTDIGGMMGVTRAAVQLMHSRALRRIRNELYRQKKLYTE